MWIWVYRYFNWIILWVIGLLEWFCFIITITLLQFDCKFVWDEGNLIRWFKRIKGIEGSNRKYCKVYIYLYLFVLFFVL